MCFRQATAVLYHIQQARSRGVTKWSSVRTRTLYPVLSRTIHSVIKDISQEWKGLGLGLLLLLRRLFHADGVHHQLQVSQDLRLVTVDVTLDSLVGQQLGEVALGHH